jgi:DNA repair protein RadC
MMTAGREAMADAELLAMIGSGTPNESAVALAARILTGMEGDLALLAFVLMEEFCLLKGMRRAKSSTIIAAMELGLRVATRYHKRVFLKAMNN